MKIVQQYCSCHFYPKPITKKDSRALVEQISRYMFSSSFSGPEMLKMAKIYCFHHFHPKIISKKESHAYVWPNLYVFWSQKRLFDPFWLVFGPKKGRYFYEYFPVLFLRTQFPKKGSLSLYGPFLAKIGQDGPQLFLPWFWSHTISNEGSHAYVPTTF